MRIVCDTNVLVSGILWPSGLPGILVDRIHHNEVHLVTSPRIWNELTRVIAEPRLHRYIAARGGERLIQTQMDWLKMLAEHVTDVPPEKAWLPQDPDDDWVIQCAVTAGAERLVTGDRALLGLEVVEGIPVVSVRAFLSELGAED